MLFLTDYFSGEKDSGETLHAVASDLSLHRPP